MSEGLSFATAVDTSGFEEGMQRIESGLQNASANVEGFGERIQSILNTEPKIDIEFITNMSQTERDIKEAYAEINATVELNQQHIAELSQEYNRLTGEINKYRNVPQKRDEVKQWIEQRNVIKENIALRKDVIEEVQKYTKVLEQNEKTLKTQNTVQNNVKLRIKEVMAEMANLRNEAQLQGKILDESTGRYRELAEELGRLKDIQGDVAQQAKILSNDENQFQGIISGVTGLSGAFSAAQGAMALFGSENKDLQEVMTKLQAVMAITIGLQQVQQMLNKDSAFQLVTINGLRKLFNNTTQEGNVAQEAENAIKTENIAVTQAQTVSTEANTVAEEINTTQQIANAEATELDAVAKESKAVASGHAAAAETGDTAATGANAAASTAGAAANFTLAGAFRAVGAAIKSIPVFGWIAAAIGVIITVVSALSKKSKEVKSDVDDLIDANKRAEAQAERTKQAIDQQTQAVEAERAALALNIAKTKNFVGTKEQEKKLVDELNSKYGETMGYFNSVAEWYAALIANSEAYCQQMIIEARTRAIANQIAQKEQESYNIRYDEKGNLRKYSTKRQMEQYVTGYSPNYGSAGGVHANYAQREIVGTSDLDKANQALRDNAAAVANLKKQLNGLVEEAASISFAVTGSPIKPGGGGGGGGKGKGGGGGSTVKPGEQIDKDKQALDKWNEAVKQYLKEAYSDIEDAEIDAMSDSLAKSLREIDFQTREKTQAWKDNFLQLAAIFKDYEKQVFMSQKGATEQKWLDSEKGKQTLEQYAEAILTDPKYAELAQEYNARLAQIEELGRQRINQTRQQYEDKWIEQYGNNQQKVELLTRQWNERLALIAKEAPDVLPQAMAAMQKELRELDFSNFKDSINWSNIFGNLGDQSLVSLEMSLNKVKEYFNQVKDSLDVKEIKTYQDAITAMENEIANRNPFTAMHKSFKDIASSKSELVTALAELTAAQNELNAANQDYNDLLLEFNLLQALVDTNKLAADDEHYLDVKQKLADALDRQTKAEQRNTQAEQQTITARNNLTKSYKQFATNLKNAGGVITDIGSKAKSLAGVFSDDVADAMGKSLDFIDEVLDATSDVISAIGDVGKSVAKGMTQTVDAMGTATKATATATATSISTVEKASIILTVISAALQIATAIANLFNNDDAHQKEIEALQERIDQLQWELDNADVLRLQQNTKKGIDELREAYAAVTNEVLRLHGLQNANSWSRFWGTMIYQSEIYKGTIEEIAKYWASVDYTANKALGAKKYEDANSRLKNMAEQQLLLQKQINEESSKKKSDSGKIQDYYNQIEELSAEMAEVINEMLEDIIGSTAEDLSKTLGNAFFEAVAAGEDAMEAWAKTTNELVADIIKRMMITKYLEEPIGQILNNYKKKWFNEDGSFKGIDAVINSADDLSRDINEVGEAFAAAWDGVSGALGKWFEEDTDREGTSRGIATASQESVDENNARLTTIQGHTYTLVQGLQELNGTANAILERVTGIEENTSETNERLNELDKKTKRVADTLETIQTSGLKLK